MLQNNIGQDNVLEDGWYFTKKIFRNSILQDDILQRFFFFRIVSCKNTILFQNCIPKKNFAQNIPLPGNISLPGGFKMANSSNDYCDVATATGPLKYRKNNIDPQSTETWEK